MHKSSSEFRFMPSVFKCEYEKQLVQCDNWSIKNFPAAWQEKQLKASEIFLSSEPYWIQQLVIVWLLCLKKIWEDSIFIVRKYFFIPNSSEANDKQSTFLYLSISLRRNLWLSSQILFFTKHFHWKLVYIPISKISNSSRNVFISSLKEGSTIFSCVIRTLCATEELGREQRKIYKQFFLQDA